MSKREKEPRELTPWQAFADFGRWEREMERLFDNFFERRFGSARSGSLWPVRSGNLPPIDLYEDQEELIAKVELPGMEREDIDVTIADHMLTVKAEKKEAEEIKQENYYRVERSHGTLRRSVELPADVDAAQVKARYKNGLLEVRMPRARVEVNRQKRIEIN